MKAAAGEYKKMFNIWPAKKCIRLYSELIQVISTARNQGRHADLNWLWSKACKINGKVLKEDRIIRKYVIIYFLKIYHLKLQWTQCNKKCKKNPCELI